MITLEITTKEVLDRLIGGDTQLETAIRYDIARSFMSNYIESLVVEYAEEFQQEYESELFGKPIWGFLNTQLKDYHLKAIDLFVKDAVDTEIKKAITPILADFGERVEQIMNDALREQIKLMAGNNLNALIEKKARELINEKLK